MIKDKNIKDRYIKLIEIINKHNLLYHTYDSPKITDDQFDAISRALSTFTDTSLETPASLIVTPDNTSAIFIVDLL